MLFTAAVYHAVPWEYIADEAQRRDLTAPGLLGYLLPPFWTVIIISAAAVALAKDLPAMLLAVSRLMFAWAADGIFPRAIASVHPVFRTPHVAIVASGGMATLGILGSHLAGDFFLGVDILVSSMLVNFLLMAVSVLTLPRRNPALARSVTVVPNSAYERWWPRSASIVLAGFLAVHTWKDLTGPAEAWYFRSTPVWAVVMAIGSLDLLARSQPASPGRRRSPRALRRVAPGMTSMPPTWNAVTCRPICPSRASSPASGSSPTWSGTGGRLDLDRAAAAMRPYVEAGLTTFDMADHYGPAEVVAGLFRSRAPQQPVQLFTKWVPKPGRVSKTEVRAAVERALTRLGVEAIDLLQYHAWNYADPSWLETLFDLQDLRTGASSVTLA